MRTPLLQLLRKSSTDNKTAVRSHCLRTGSVQSTSYGVVKKKYILRSYRSTTNYKQQQPRGYGTCIQQCCLRQPRYESVNSRSRHSHNISATGPACTTQADSQSNFREPSTATTSRQPTHRPGLNYTDRFTVQLPGTLQGSRCDTDASTLLDQTALPTKNAGLGVLIIDTQVHPSQNIYIKAS
jgi:hypothetical protein